MKKILLIEDNAEVRNTTAEILELSNYKVIVAENGKVGLDKILSHPPDLVICDIMMPVIDGYGVLEALKSKTAITKMPFIFLSAKSEEAEVQKGLTLGADDYITKPFDASKLLDTVYINLRKIEIINKIDIIPGDETTPNEMNDYLTNI